MGDIAPVASIVREPNVMVVNPSVPATSLPEFIAHAKSNPGRLSMASGGNGTASHMAGELFKMMAGVATVQAELRSLTNGLPSRTNVCTRRKRTCGPQGGNPGLTQLRHRLD